MKQAIRENLIHRQMIIDGEFHPDKSGQVLTIKKHLRSKHYYHLE